MVTATLYAIAMAVLLLYGLNLLWMAAMYARQDRLRPGPVPDPDDLPHPDRSWPTVTVQLPLYNEAHVVERLIDACAALRYPRRRLEIQVLDDSTDETVGLAARRVRYWQERGLDIVHIHRTDRTGYKAGALQNGLRFARGTFIAIFDADFLPTRDFLQRMIPAFDDADVGMVQARWGHLNADGSLLTQIQAFGLDAHFAIEQYVRNRAGCFMNFNGTAGVWRRDCIEDAGGWDGDTLAEDLDLSYRAQLNGWRFKYMTDVEVPAELPVDMNALRAQQFRWTKGAAETARKLLGRLWRSEQPSRVKWEGTLHLTAHIVFPFVILAAALHAPLLVLENLGRGPGAIYFALMGFGLLGFLGFFLAQLFAQRALYPDWSRRLLYFPFFMAGSMGMAVNNTRAIAQALLGKRTAFVRTPKYSDAGTGTGSWWRSRYADTRIPPVMWIEAGLAAYCLVGLVVIAAFGEWAAVPFQAFFALGFGLVTAYNIRQFRLQRSSAAA
ncbi:MAG: glycosyltransferase [Bacteroidetes bacterium]|jgi:cellulose synthase/poly-beta-1,6-N-acetylglucosamine synthase-like glycosyltransferase|nr:glycosyltransferase [Bacteroidota bacterium]